MTVHAPGAAPSYARTSPVATRNWPPFPSFDGSMPSLGAWVVDGESAGLGIRSSSGLVTDEYARFLPA